MSLDAPVHSIVSRGVSSEDRDTLQANRSKLTNRLLQVFSTTFDLGFTAFGGPPVHFQIFHRRLVDGHGKTSWIDEHTYQELFAITQALPGPASTKLLFNIVQIHAGMIPAILAFFLWSLPGAIAMYGLSVGVQRIGETLPDPVYALLSGLNAATVGIIALAAIQLARKSITDPLTRLLVAFGGCAGLCYNALWYFPVLLVIAGLVTVAWDIVGRSLLNKLRDKRGRSPVPPELEAGLETDDIPMDEMKLSDTLGPHWKRSAVIAPYERRPLKEIPPPLSQLPRDASTYAIPIKLGLIIITLFFSSFTVLMILRGALHHPPLSFAFFNDMFLAGTIIFGGGPVVIPLLRQYVVDPGWVSPRDFLLGLAVIQAMPGPNFNFAVYLGALVIAGPAPSKSMQTITGALLGYFGIFLPGLWLSIGFQSIWQPLRKRREVVSILRGINAAAVGLVFTAVYRLWEIGYLTAEQTKGAHLGQEPWWLVVAASTFTAVEWFSVPPPVAILAGGTAGLGWWGAVGRHLTHLSAGE